MTFRERCAEFDRKLQALTAEWQAWRAALAAHGITVEEA